MKFPPDYETRVWVSDAPVKDIDYSPSQELLGIASADNQVRIYEAETGSLHRVIPLPAGSQLERLAFFPDGSRFATLEKNYFWEMDPSTVYRVWETATGKDLSHHGMNITGEADILISPDGTKLFFLQAWGWGFSPYV